MTLFSRGSPRRRHPLYFSGGGEGGTSGLDDHADHHELGGRDEVAISEVQILDGTLLARVAANETITGLYTFQNQVAVQTNLVGAVPSFEVENVGDDTRVWITNALTGDSNQIALRNANTGPTAIPSGAFLGTLEGWGYDDAGYDPGTIIIFSASETWTATAHGCEISFWNIANGTTSQTKRMEILNDGSVIIGGTDPGGTDTLRVNGTARVGDHSIAAPLGATLIHGVEGAGAARLVMSANAASTPVHALFSAETNLAIVGAYSNHRLELRTNNTARVNIEADGTVIILSTEDAGLGGVSGALIIGGDGTGAHIAMDSNEIMAKASATTASTLFLNADGGDVTIHNVVAQNFNVGPGGNRFQVTTAGQVNVPIGPLVVATDPGGTANTRLGGRLTVGTGAQSTLTPLLELAHPQPNIIINETDQAADNRLWSIVGLSGNLTFRARSDDGTSNANFLRVTRTGATIDTVEFQNGDVVIGTDPGGSQLIRATGDLHLGGIGGVGATITLDGAANNTHLIVGDANRTTGESGLLDFRGRWNGDDVARIVLTSGFDTTNKDDGKIFFMTQATAAGGLLTRMIINHDGSVVIGTDPGGTDTLRVNGTARVGDHSIAAPLGATLIHGVEGSGAARLVMSANAASTPTHALFSAEGGLGIVGTYSNHRLEIRTNNTARVNIEAGGNVTVTDGQFTVRSGTNPSASTIGRFGNVGSPAAGNPELLLKTTTDDRVFFQTWDGTASRTFLYFDHPNNKIQASGRFDHVGLIAARPAAETIMDTDGGLSDTRKIVFNANRAEFGYEADVGPFIQGGAGKSIVMKPSGSQTFILNSDGSAVFGAGNPGGSMGVRMSYANGNLLRLDNSSIVNLAWDVRVSGSGVLEFRSVNDAGTTTLNALQLFHATGSIISKGAVFTMDRDINHIITMSSTTSDTFHVLRGDANRTTSGSALLSLEGKWNGNQAARILLTSGVDTTNKDDGIIYFQTQASAAGGYVTHLTIREDGDVEVSSSSYLDIKRPVALGGGAAPTLGTIGGSGPATAAQNEWVEIKVGNNVRWIPVWA